MATHPASNRAELEAV